MNPSINLFIGIVFLFFSLIAAIINPNQYLIIIITWPIIGSMNIAIYDYSIREMS